MKKFILLGALSVLFYSAPGNAAGRETDDMDQALGGKEAAPQQAQMEQAYEAHEQLDAQCDQMNHQWKQLLDELKQAEKAVARLEAESEQAEETFRQAADTYRQVTTYRQVAPYTHVARAGDEGDKGDKDELDGARAQCIRAKEEAAQKRTIYVNSARTYDQKKAGLDQMTVQRVQVQANCDREKSKWDEARAQVNREGVIFGQVWDEEQALLQAQEEEARKEWKRQKQRQQKKS